LFAWSFVVGISLAVAGSTAIPDIARANEPYNAAEPGDRCDEQGKV